MPNPTDKHVGSRVRIEGFPGVPGGKGDAPSPTYVSEFLATTDGLSLTKSFMRIKEPEHRRSIVDLVQQIAGVDN
jgi:hypothetical protein